MPRVRAARVLAFAVALATCALTTQSLQPTRPVGAQEPLGTWEVDMLAADRVSGSIAWDFMQYREDDCQNTGMGPNMQASLDLVSFSVGLDLDGGAVTGDLNGTYAVEAVGLGYQEDQQWVDGNWVEGKWVQLGRVDAEGSFRGTIADGWVRRSDGEWELGGTLILDLEGTDYCVCWNEGTHRMDELVITDESTQIQLEFTGYTSMAGYAGGKINVKAETTISSDDEYLSFSLDVRDANLPAGFPGPASAGEPGIIVGDELDVVLLVVPQRDSSGAVVFAAEVFGADPDLCTYSWDIDGFYQATTWSPAWAWGEAEDGTFTAGVEVSDSQSTAKATKRFRVSGNTVEEIEGEEFDVRLGCQPGTPRPGVTVVCTVQVLGAREGETFEYHWYLDDASVGTTTSPSWTWEAAQPGTHDVGVQVVGEGRSADADFTLTVGAVEDLVATIEMAPDPPVEGRGVVLSARVEGRLANETLAYNWFLDGQSVCEDSACSLDPLEGTHTLQLDVHGNEGRVATDVREFTVAPAEGTVTDAGDAAGFAITGLECTDGISSDETLVCTAQFKRSQAGIGPLDVIWLIDGATAASESTPDDSASWSLDRPAPGVHDIVVQVIDPATDMARVRSDSVEVRAGRNAMIPPIMQLGAAGGTLATVSVWLWLEWWRQRLAATEAAALERDRQRWFDQVGELNRLERERRLRREGFEYEEETDTWRPGAYHPDVLARRIRAEMRKAEMHVSRMMEKLPEGRWGKIEDLMEELSSPTNPNVEDLVRVRRLQRAVFDTVQAQWEGEAAQAELDAIWHADWERRITKARMILGLLELTVPIAVAAEIPRLLAAQLAAVNLGGNFLEGLAEGYFEGGVTQGLARAAQYTLPVNMVVSIYETVRGDYDEESAGWRVARILFSTVRDVGNAFSLADGARGMGTLLKRSDVACRAYRRVRRTLEQVSDTVGIDAQWLTGRRRGQELVEEFKETYARYRGAANKAERKALLQKLEEQAIQINSSYQAKAILKAQGRSKLARVFDNRIQRVYRRVDAKAIQFMNRDGLQRGGRAFTVDDMWDIRNKSSWGTAGMDRDWALNERYVTRLREELSAAAPGSKEAQKIARELMEARRASRITWKGKEMSLAEWNDEAQRIYGEAYRSVTRQDADEAFQAVTQMQNVEAYADLNVLQNDPMAVPFRRQWSAQTASVTAYKTYHNRILVGRGQLSEADAIQETFRGLEKDMRTKLMPLVRGSQGVPFQQQRRLRMMQQLFGRAGEGRIAPGRATRMLQRQFGVTLEGAVEEVTANLETAILVRGR